jgi:hypothetical protein
MKPRFLIDENTRRRRLLAAIRQYDAAIDVIAVGDPGAPAIGTLDPDIRRYCEATQRLLITQNRKSMPVHIAVHLADGRHHYGVFGLRPGYSLGAYVAAIHLLWAASEAEEWIGGDECIPW